MSVPGGCGTVKNTPWPYFCKMWEFLFKTTCRERTPSCLQCLKPAQLFVQVSAVNLFVWRKLSTGIDLVKMRARCCSGSFAGICWNKRFVAGHVAGKPHDGYPTRAHESPLHADLFGKPWKRTSNGSKTYICFLGLRRREVLRLGAFVLWNLSRTQTDKQTNK